jgi:hypothetical protein
VKLKLAYSISALFLLLTSLRVCYNPWYDIVSSQATSYRANNSEYLINLKYYIAIVLVLPYSSYHLKASVLSAVKYPSLLLEVVIIRPLFFKTLTAALTSS